MTELKELRTHQEKHFELPDGRRQIVLSAGLLHAKTDKGFEDIQTELPDYSFPNALPISTGKDTHFVQDLPSWGDARVEDDGATVRVYDRDGRSIYKFQNLVAVPKGEMPLIVEKPGGSKVGAVDGVAIGMGDVLTKNTQAVDLKFSVVDGKMYAILPPTLTGKSAELDLYDLTDTASTNNADNSIRSADIANLGTNTTNYISAQTGNLYTMLNTWTLSADPGSATITDVSVSLYKASNSGTTAFNINLYEILRAWGETTSHWNNWTTGSAWTTAGAKGAGTDYTNTLISATARTTSSGSYQTFPIYGTGVTNNFPGIAWGATIRFKLEPSATSAAADYFDYNSKENASNKPYVTITYTSGGGATVVPLCNLSLLGVS